MSETDDHRWCEVHHLAWSVHEDGRCPLCASHDEDDEAPPFDDRGGRE